MNEKLCLILCDNLKMEAETILCSEAFEDVDILSFPAICGPQDNRWEEVITKALGHKHYNEIQILSGSCDHRGIKPPLSHRYKTHHLGHCHAMLISPSVLNRLIRQKAYLCSPGWIVRWPQYLQQWKMDRETASSYFVGFAKKLVLLDTGLEYNAVKHLKDCAAYLNLPYEIVSTDLEYFRLFLTNIVLNWRLARQAQHNRNTLKTSVTELTKDSSPLLGGSNCQANLTLIANLISSLSEISSEDKVIAKILKLFSALLISQQISYIQVTDTQYGYLCRMTGDEDMLKEKLDPLSEYPFGGQIKENDCKQLCLPVRYLNETLGFLIADGLAFPEHRDRYQDTARTMAQVCSLAIYNARVYQKSISAQQELKSQQQIMSAFINAASDAIGLFDKRLELVDYNTRFAQNFGLTVKELEKVEDIFSLMPLDVSKQRKDRIQNVFNTQEADYWEDQRNGVWFDNAIFPVKTQSGRVEMVGLIARDVSERKKIDQTLKESEEKFRAIFDHANDGIILANGQTQKFVLVNDTICQMLGYSRDELLSMSVSQIHPSEDLPFINELFKKQTFSNNRIVENLPVKRRDGSIFYVDINSSPLSLGENLYLMGIFRDISDRKKTEQALILAKIKAESADRAKSLFLATMSHEIRTPMNAVLGFTDLLLKDELTSSQEVYLRTIKSSGTLLLSLINDILDFSKIEAGQLVISKTECSVLEILDKVDSYANMLLSQSKKRIEIVRKKQANVSDYIFADPLRLFQVMNNFISNAIKFTDAGSIEFGVRLAPEPNFLELYVSDTGIGVAKKKQKAIFEPFQQADVVTTRKYGGTGLGLAIVKQLANLMQGYPVLFSKTGKEHGSTFALRIPYEPVLEPQGKKVNKNTKQQTVNIKNTSGKMILLVEDNTVNQFLARKILEKANHSVVIANNGYEALQLFQSIQDIGLILMDLYLPGIDGMETTKQIRMMEKHRNPAGGIPIIALTAAVMPGDQQAFQQAGCDDYLTKPIDGEQLIATIDKFLGNTSA